jgi:predicted HAD superfamily Cof-like phosphohydrolase
MESIKSNSDDVREFTSGAGQPTPDKPCVMNNDEVIFLTKMILDETMELMATILLPKESKNIMKQLIDDSKDIPKEKYAQGEEYKKIADQADALVDIYYYSLNAACKKGINLSSIFSVVHGANMAKRDPKTNKFLKREDGKIIKPEGWTPPDVEGEIKRQLKDGSFNYINNNIDRINLIIEKLAKKNGEYWELAQKSNGLERDKFIKKAGELQKEVSYFKQLQKKSLIKQFLKTTDIDNKIMDEILSLND